VSASSRVIERPRRATRVGRWAALLLSVATAGCAAHVATLPGILGAEAYPPAMVLVTGATGEDCGTSILFVRLRRASLADAVTRAIASVPDATLLTDVEIDATALVTGVYNRGCIRVKGSAAKLVSSVVVPMPDDHHAHHGESH
jgi:hypothetical protein